MSNGFAAIGLYQPKTPVNVGSVLRAAGCYGVALLAIQGRRFQRACTDPSNAYRILPVIRCEDLHDVVPIDCVPVAVEIASNAMSLVDYVHPERAFYVFGPEDGTLGQKVINWCRDVVYVPTNGCMNLAATVNVVLYDRAAKSKKRAKHPPLLSKNLLRGKMDTIKKISPHELSKERDFLTCHS